MLEPASKRPEDREFVVDSGASMHMLSKKVLNSDELETLQKSGNPTTVATAAEKVQTSEEAQKNVHDLDLFDLQLYHLENFAKKTDSIALGTVEVSVMKLLAPSRVS